jgi:hypothetical protein
MTCTCEANVPGVFLCHRCCEALEQVLIKLDGVDAALNVAIRDVKTTATYGPQEGSGGGAEFGPAPLNVGALSVRKEIHDYLMDTALMVATDTRDPLTGTDVHGLTNYLYSHVPWLRTDTKGPELLERSGKFVRAAKNVIETGGERINVGRCGYVFQEVECVQPLNPYKTQDTVKCGVCGTVWDVKERQRDAIGGAWTAIAYPPVIIRSLEAYGIKIKTKHFENWVAAGHLKPARELAGRKQYRVNEVWAVANRMQERKRKVA